MTFRSRRVQKTHSESSTVTGFDRRGSGRVTPFSTEAGGAFFSPEVFTSDFLGTFLIQGVIKLPKGMVFSDQIMQRYGNFEGIPPLEWCIVRVGNIMNPAI